jgi:hypothetical protein
MVERVWRIAMGGFAQAAALVVARVLTAVIVVLGCGGVARGDADVLIADAMDSLDRGGWTLVAAEGVRASVRADAGAGVLMEYDFVKGSGFVILRRELKIDLPENYRVSVEMRGEGRANNLELKLVDESGENVWWVNRRGMTWAGEWTTVHTPRRMFEFAWGPAGAGKGLTRAGSVEIVIAANTPQARGGRGKVWLRNFRVEKLDVPAATPVGWIEAKREMVGANQEQLPREAEFELGGLCDIGGVVVEFPRGQAREYRVELATRAGEFAVAARVKTSGGARDFVRLPASAARAVRVVFEGEVDKARAWLMLPTRIRVLSAAAGESANAFLREVAREEVGAGGARGLYPRTMLGEQRYWTVLGVPEDEAEALVAEDGSVEVGRGLLSLEPMVELEGAGGSKRLTWADARTSVDLRERVLPMPGVTHEFEGGLTLRVEHAAVGEAGASAIVSRYVLKAGNEAVRGRVVVAARCWQVLPPWQELNITGGFTAITRARVEREALVLTQAEREVRVMPMGADGGAWSFAAGAFAEGRAARATRELRGAELSVEDSTGMLHAEMRGPMVELAAGASAEFVIVTPMHDGAEKALGLGAATRGDDPRLRAMVEAEAATWRGLVNRVGLTLPESARAIVETFKTQQAYILINQDGPRIQPGSRTYERSWIRDGSLTGTALLATGHADRARAFVEWYAPYQFESGKVPCVVDGRGPDPTAEHDSHGQLIYALHKLYRFTRDRAVLERNLERVERAVAYIDSLRKERMTDAYRPGPGVSALDAAKFGIVPESISHEGYSAKPMHSYWDGFFVVKGLKDAVRIAEIVGREDLAAKWRPIRDEYIAAHYESLRRATAAHGIEYLPGCVELGDFDATSTTVAIFPCGELDRARQEVRRSDGAALIDLTFEKWWTYFVDRRDGRVKSAEYTPYELRSVGSFVYLGQRGRAHEALEFYFADQRPGAWRQWGEIVWRDPAAAKFIGDMPHTWVGSDFVNAVRAMFVYERESDESLVLGAGILDSWLEGNEAEKAAVAIEGWPTEYGVVTYGLRPTAAGVEWRIEFKGDVPPGGLVLAWPESAAREVKVDGRVVTERPVRVRGSAVVEVGR